MLKMKLKWFLYMMLFFSQTNGQPIRTKLIKENNISLSGRINQYDKDQYNLLTNRSKFSLREGVQEEPFLQSNWEITTKIVDVKEHPGAIDVTVKFLCKNGNLPSGSVSVDLDIDHWSENNYVLFPGAVYNGNRFDWRRISYSPKLLKAKDIGIDKPMIVTDIPKLNGEGAVSRIQERSGSMSTPSVGYISDSLKKGIWLLCPQGNLLGDYEIDLAETRDRTKAILSLTSPIVREQYVYKICDARFPSWDIPKDFKTGDEVSITFRLNDFVAPTTQSIFDKFVEIRKDLNTSNQVVNSIPYSECMHVLENKFNEKNFVSDIGYYSVGLRENPMQDWQIGWTGGMISTYPLLFSGGEKTRQNVLRNFDWLFPNGISPSGFYWDSGQKGTEWLGGDIRNFHTKNWHLIRKSGDAAWYITKQFLLMDKLGIPVKQGWKDGNRTVCNAFVNLWGKYHQLGQFVDSQSGEIVVGGSCSGAIVPAALALASQYYKEPKYLETAKEIGLFLYENFTKKGITCGGPGDALQNPDSESSYALVESFVTLYEQTQEKSWLDCAEDAANQFATWVVAYNYNYPENTAFFKAGIHTVGGVYANTQNKHSAPGICTASGLGLLKLYRYTGKSFYIQLLHDISHNITQYLPVKEKPLGNAQLGFVSERVNLTDWEGPGSIGYILPMSSWAETSLMLTTIEIPGVYIQPDDNYCVAFDNIEVKILENTKRQITLELNNPTLFEANVSVLSESKTDRSNILPDNYMLGMQKISIGPKAVRKISFRKH